MTLAVLAAMAWNDGVVQPTVMGVTMSVVNAGGWINRPDFGRTRGHDQHAGTHGCCTGPMGLAAVLVGLSVLPFAANKQQAQLTFPCNGCPR